MPYLNIEKHPGNEHYTGYGVLHSVWRVYRHGRRSWYAVPVGKGCGRAFYGKTLREVSEELRCR